MLVFSAHMGKSWPHQLTVGGSEQLALSAAALTGTAAEMAICGSHRQWNASACKTSAPAYPVHDTVFTR